MGAYVIRRVIYAVVTMLVVSVVAYIIIQLPPGDYLTSYIMRLEMQGGEVTDAEVETLKREYGFDLPPHLRYFKWMANLLRGDLGRSFFYNRPVLELLAERLPLSLLVSLLALLFTYLVSIPVGIYSATHQYSLWDYTLSLVGFVGLATPNFILALLLMFFFFKTFGLSTGSAPSAGRCRRSCPGRPSSPSCSACPPWARCCWRRWSTRISSWPAAW